MCTVIEYTQTCARVLQLKGYVCCVLAALPFLGLQYYLILYTFPFSLSRLSSFLLPPSFLPPSSFLPPFLPLPEIRLSSNLLRAPLHPEQEDRVQIAARSVSDPLPSFPFSLPPPPLSPSSHLLPNLSLNPPSPPLHYFPQVLTHLLNLLGHFPFGCGAAQMASVVREYHDCPSLQHLDELSSDIFDSPRVQVRVATANKELLSVGKDNIGTYVLY